MAEASLLEARGVTKEFGTRGARGGTIAAVDGVNLALPETPTLLTLIGESGSGKTTLSRMLLGLEKPTRGAVCYRGKDIHALSKPERAVYRREVQAIFQDPYAIYNSFYHVEHVFTMVIRQFKLAANAGEVRRMMEDSLRAVDLRPNDVLGHYPHQLSGGERQRVMLARIHVLRPRVIIADEPVSMIDAAVRTLFMNILLDFRDQYGISCLFITHNLSTAYYLGGQIAVMRFGRVIEEGDMDTIIERPSHPYTRQLLAAVPSGDPEQRWTTRATYENADRSLLHDAHKCLYAARCPHVMPVCTQECPPDYVREEGAARVACYLYQHEGPQCRRKATGDEADRGILARGRAARGLRRNRHGRAARRRARAHRHLRPVRNARLQNLRPATTPIAGDDHEPRIREHP